MLAARHAVTIDTASACINFMITPRLCIVVVGTGRLRYSAPFSGFPQHRCDVCDFASSAYPEDVRCWRRSGHRANLRECPLLTQSGHQRSTVAQPVLHLARSRQWKRRHVLRTCDSEVLLRAVAT